MAALVPTPDLCLVLSGNRSILKYCDHKSRARLLRTSKAILETVSALLTEDEYFAIATLMDFKDAFEEQSIFIPECHNHMLPYMDTAIGQCYFRLQSFVWSLASFKRAKTFQKSIPLKDWFYLVPIHTPLRASWTRKPSKNMNASKQSIRSLNKYEKLLFRPYPLQLKTSNELYDILISEKKESSLVFSRTRFRRNMEKMFHLSAWEDIMDWNQFFIAGGSILRNTSPMVYNHMRSYTKSQDLDCFSIGCETREEFEEEVEKFIFRCVQSGFEVVKEPTPMEEEMRYRSADFFKVVDYIIAIPIDSPHMSPKESSKNFVRNAVNGFSDNNKSNNKSHVTQSDAKEDRIELQFQFIWAPNVTRWGTLIGFDMSCCQIGYDGINVMATTAFIQTIASGGYTSVYRNPCTKKQVQRMRKYVSRGFTMLVDRDITVEELKDVKDVRHGASDQLDTFNTRNNFVRRVVCEL